MTETVKLSMSEFMNMSIKLREQNEKKEQEKKDKITRTRSKKIKGINRKKYKLPSFF